MKNSTIKFISASTVALLALAGCSKSDESAENLPVAEPVVTQITAVCDDHSLKNRLNDALQSALLDASLSRLTGMSELQMQDMETKVRSQLGTVSFDLQNVSNTDTGCSTDVYITPSAQDVLAAEQLFAQTNVNLNEHVQASGAQLIAGRVVIPNLTYQIIDNKAVLDQPSHPAFGVVADLLIMATNAPKNTTGTSAAVEAVVVAPTVAPRVQAADVQAQVADAQIIQSNQTTTPVTIERADSAKPKQVATPAKPQQPQPQKPKQKTESASTDQVSDAQPAKEVTKQAQSTSHASEEITIVETDDTY